MKTLQSLLSPLLTLVLIVGPLAPLAARADAAADFHQTCDATLASNNSGDMALGSCKQGQMAEKVNKVEKSNKIIFGVATIATAIMSRFENGPAAPVVKPICIGMGLAGMAKVSFIDPAASRQNDEIVGSFAKTINQVVGMGTKIGTGYLGLQIGKGIMHGGLDGAGRAIGNVVKGVDNATKTGEAKKNRGCLMASLGLGILTVSAAMSASASKKALEDSTKVAKDGIQGVQKSSSYVFRPTGNNAPPPNNNPAAPKNDPAATVPCSSKSGTEYAKCLGTLNPEISKLVNDPKIMDNMNTALGGKNIGDFAKNFKGDSLSDAAHYIANGMGVDAGGVMAALDSSAKAAKLAGVPMDAYKPSAYGESGHGGSGGKAGADPMEQMLADMMKKMGDTGEDGLGKEQNPQELVFNQLELLPPEKIVEDPKVSLFYRASFRIQKNWNNLEQMNPTLREPAAANAPGH